MIGMEAAFFGDMRQIKLTGREAAVIRAMGFGEALVGAEIQDNTRMEVEELTDVLNTLISAGFVESIPYTEDVQMADMVATAFEINPAYSQELHRAARFRI
jgi:hypothetical protein